MSDPVIGMIVPPAAGEVPPEAKGLYPTGARFVARGLALKALTVEDYGVAIRRVDELARALVEEDGAEALSLMGTSLSFFRGPDFNAELIEVMRAAGAPATSMSASVVDALRVLGARRIAVGTAYTEEVNARLRAFLGASGFEIASTIGLNLSAIEDILAVRADEVTALALRAAEAAGGRADAIFVSCGGLPALHLAQAVEPRAGMPVVASSTAGVWGAARLVGLPTRLPQLGALGEASQPLPAIGAER